RSGTSARPSTHPRSCALRPVTTRSWPSTLAGRWRASLAVRDVRPADRAIDPEQLDAVRLSAQHPLAHVGHAQLESHERVPGAERGRGRKRRAVTLDEAVVSLPERGERAEEPRV